MKNKERADKQDYNTLEDKKNDLEVEVDVLKDSEKVADQRMRTKLMLFLDVVKESMKRYENF
jgi:hypothetical protein